MILVMQRRTEKLHSYGQYFGNKRQDFEDMQDSGRQEYHLSRNRKASKTRLEAEDYLPTFTN